MKTVVLAVSLLSAVCLVAQTPTLPQAYTDALQLRVGLVDAVERGTEKPETALARLKQLERPMGHKADQDADFAFAAIDIGHRLSGADKSKQAEVFFSAAEKSLDLALKKTPDSASAEKVQLLQQLALIRSQFLGQVTQAMADLDEALRLQPDNNYLQLIRAGIVQAHPEHFKETATTEGRK